MDIQKFIEALDKVKQTSNMLYNTLSSSLLYGYDVKADGRTYLTDDSNDADKGLNIENPDSLSVHHVCVDGGMVEYGTPDYIGDGKPHGRFDSLIFTDDLLLLVEYKMNTISDSDKSRWKRFGDGIGQIEEYYQHLKKQLTNLGEDIGNYFIDVNIIPFVCMSKLPILKPQTNLQRFRQMESFREKTGLKIQYGTKWSFISTEKITER